MNRLVETTATLMVGGDERDVPIRCWIDVGPIEATLDGTPEMQVDGEWRALTAAETKGVEDLLCEQAIQDELDAASDIDPDEYANDDERSCA